MFTEAGAAPCDSEGIQGSFLVLRAESIAKILQSFTTKAILDNVVDLGELVMQFYALYVDRRFIRLHWAFSGVAAA